MMILQITGLEEEKDYSIELYTERDRTQRVEKKDVIRAFYDGMWKGYIQVDENAVGMGHLMARVTIRNTRPQQEMRMAEMTLQGYTGYDVPRYGTKGRTITEADKEVTFQVVDGIPMDAMAMIYYGTTEDSIEGFECVTEEMLMTLNTIPARQTTLVVEAKEGKALVVAIPQWTGMTAMKQDGVGGTMPFSKKIMGANGEVTIKTQMGEMKVFGELMTVDGFLKVYIE